MTTRNSNSKEDTRYRLLRLLDQDADLTQREIASKLDISLGGVNYALRALVDRGLVKIQNFHDSNNKLGYTYFLTPQGLYEKSTLTARFLKRKLREYEELKEEIESLKKEVSDLNPSDDEEV